MLFASIILARKSITIIEKITLQFCWGRGYFSTCQKDNSSWKEKKITNWIWANFKSSFRTCTKGFSIKQTYASSNFLKFLKKFFAAIDISFISLSYLKAWNFTLNVMLKCISNDLIKREGFKVKKKLYLPNTYHRISNTFGLYTTILIYPKIYLRSWQVMFITNSSFYSFWNLANHA